MHHICNEIVMHNVTSVSQNALARNIQKQYVGMHSCILVVHVVTASERAHRLPRSMEVCSVGVFFIALCGCFHVSRSSGKPWAPQQQAFM